MTENERGRGVRSRSDWVALFEAQEKSQRSVKVFCEEQGISYSNFLYHRRNRLKKSQGANVSTKAVSVSGGFIPIHVNKTTGLRLRFPMGLVLESDGCLSASWVVEVARRWADGEGFLC